MSDAAIDEYNAVAESCAGLISIARDSQLQRDAVDRLDAFKPKLIRWKLDAVEAGDERRANALLGCQCVVGCLISELKMWLALKDSQPENAWDYLIDAQLAASDAMRASEGFSHMKIHAERLLTIEDVVFPPQVYMSAGMIVTRQECSVCGEEYEDCPHIKGYPYWGEFCRCILREIKVDHVAMVKNPANKRCRITHFSAEGGRRNRMTWKIEPGEITGDPNPEKKGLMTTAKLIQMTMSVVIRAIWNNRRFNGGAHCNSSYKAATAPPAKSEYSADGVVKQPPHLRPVAGQRQALPPPAVEQVEA